MTADTTRRKRAEKWMMDDSETAQVEWKLAWDAAKESRFIADSDRRLLIAYLAGAREEAAEKDKEIAALRDRVSRYERTQADWPIVEGEYKAEIAALQQNDANREALLDSLLRLRNEHILEIAALREFVRWHFMHHPQSWPGNAEIMPAVHRALEETP